MMLAMKLNRPLQIASGTARKASSSFVMAVCIIWVVASVIGFAVEAFAAAPSGLRGSQSPSAPPKSEPLRGNMRNQSIAANTPQSWLGNSVWRTGPCNEFQNFQTFTFSGQQKVEVGNGKPGDGERLELLRISTDAAGLIQIETRVCAPVGCNQTVERYKKLGPNQIQEWHFEGRLPDHVPYVIVANGAASDGSGPGRVFNRCSL